VPIKWVRQWEQEKRRNEVESTLSRCSAGRSHVSSLEIPRRIVPFARGRQGVTQLHVLRGKPLHLALCLAEALLHDLRLDAPRPSEGGVARSWRGGGGVKQVPKMGSVIAARLLRLS